MDPEEDLSQQRDPQRGRHCDLLQEELDDSMISEEVATFMQMLYDRMGRGVLCFSEEVPVAIKRDYLVTLAEEIQLWRQGGGGQPGSEKFKKDTVSVSFDNKLETKAVNKISRMCMLRFTRPTPPTQRTPVPSLIPPRSPTRSNPKKRAFSEITVQDDDDNSALNNELTHANSHPPPPKRRRTTANKRGEASARTLRKQKREKRKRGKAQRDKPQSDKPQRGKQEKDPDSDDCDMADATSDSESTTAEMAYMKQRPNLHKVIWIGFVKQHARKLNAARQVMYLATSMIAQLLDNIEADITEVVLPWVPEIVMCWDTEMLKQAAQTCHATSNSVMSGLMHMPMRIKSMEDLVSALSAVASRLANARFHGSDTLNIKRDDGLLGWAGYFCAKSDQENGGVDADRGYLYTVNDDEHSGHSLRASKAYLEDFTRTLGIQIMHPRGIGEKKPDYDKRKAREKKRRVEMPAILNARVMIRTNESEHKALGPYSMAPKLSDEPPSAGKVLSWLEAYVTTRYQRDPTCRRMTHLLECGTKLEIIDSALSVYNPQTQKLMAEHMLDLLDAWKPVHTRLLEEAQRPGYRGLQPFKFMPLSMDEQRESDMDDEENQDSATKILNELQRLRKGVMEYNECASWISQLLFDQMRAAELMRATIVGYKMQKRDIQGSPYDEYWALVDTFFREHRNTNPLLIMLTYDFRTPLEPAKKKHKNAVDGGHMSKAFTCSSNNWSQPVLVFSIDKGAVTYRADLRDHSGLTEAQKYQRDLFRRSTSLEGALPRTAHSYSGMSCLPTFNLRLATAKARRDARRSPKKPRERTRDSELSGITRPFFYKTDEDAVDLSELVDSVLI